VKPPGVRAIAAIAAVLGLTGLTAVAAVGATAATPASAVQARLAPAATVPTGVDDFTFESFDAQYYLGLDDNGYVTTRVVETIVALFDTPNQNRGIIRAIPDEAFGYDLDVQLTSITNAAGSPVYVERYDTSYYDDSGELLDWVEFYVDDDTYKLGLTTYVIEYTMKNTIVNTTNGVQEFYWDINGSGWPQPFGSVTAQVHLSPDLRDGLIQGDESCYHGSYGDRTGSERCTLTPTDDGFEASAGDVSPYATLTVALPFEPGTVTQRVRPADSWIVQVAPKVIAGLIGLLIVVGFVIRATLWRSPRPGIVIAQYDPPEGQHLLLSADLIDNPYRGLPAQFIDFAVRGMIRIIDTKPSSVDSLDKNRYELEFVTADGATPKELRVLTILFGASPDAGKKVNPGRMSAKTGAALYGLRAETVAQATKEGYRALPDAALPKLLRRIAGWSLALFVAIWIYAFMNDVEDDGPITLYMWLSIVGFIMVAIVLVRPNRLTVKGAAARDYLLGMQLYLTVAEEQRMRFLQSPQGAQRRIDPHDAQAVVHLYERLLPYAVVWNVEQEWLEQLRVRYVEAPPTWVTSDVVDTSFIHSFTYSSTANVQPIVTQSSSSGGGSWSSSGGSSSFSGGSSGGGFSGGGGGGGGGGGR
jgi:uncharacterized membrane protein YgcG